MNMEIPHTDVVEAWKRRCADLTEQVVILESALAVLQREAEPEVGDE